MKLKLIQSTGYPMNLEQRFFSSIFLPECLLLTSRISVSYGSSTGCCGIASLLSNGLKYTFSIHRQNTWVVHGESWSQVHASTITGADAPYTHVVKCSTARFMTPSTGFLSTNLQPILASALTGLRGGELIQSRRVEYGLTTIRKFRTAAQSTEGCTSLRYRNSCIHLAVYNKHGYFHFCDVPDGTSSNVGAPFQIWCVPGRASSETRLKSYAKGVFLD